MIILYVRRCAEEHVLHSTSNLDDIKDRMHTCWENVDQQIIDKSIDNWLNKLKAVVRLNGGHIGQLFWLSGSFGKFLTLMIKDVVQTVNKQ